MFKIYNGATEFKQWELDQMVTNPCMKAGDEVVFRNASGETYVTKAFEQNGEVVADVPNYLLQKALNILVDLEQGADKHDDCRTTFVVVAQEMPEGYECKHNLPDRPVKTAGGVSSWNDLTDKPFGSEFVETFHETTLEFSEEDGTTDLNAALGLIPGAKYIVKWNGTEYVCVCQSHVEGGMAAAVLGDFGLMVGGESTGEPFIIMDGGEPLFEAAGTYGMIMTLAGDTSATISIKGEVVKQIEGKYIPKMMVTFTGDAANGFSADKTYEEILEAISGGVDVTGVLNMDYGNGSKTRYIFSFSGISAYTSEDAEYTDLVFVNVMSGVCTTVSYRDSGTITLSQSGL